MNFLNGNGNGNANANANRKNQYQYQVYTSILSTSSYLKIYIDIHILQTSI
jgi:hypothetical protein